MQRAQVTSGNRSLSSVLLPGIHSGNIQLPDFQRSWVWTDIQVRELLASIASSYPIGAIMLLQAGERHEFQFRPIDGAPTPPAAHVPQHLILDGQQRLTALYQALSPTAAPSDPRRHYFVGIREALDPTDDDVDAIVSTNGEGIVQQPLKYRGLDLSVTTNQYEHLIIPATQIFNPIQWIFDCDSHDGDHPKRLNLLKTFEEDVVRLFQNYEIPVITLGPDTPLEAVCHVFERVNSTGVKLQVFELMTATYAATGFRLRTDWELREERLRGSNLRLLADWPTNDTLRDDFLQSVALLATYQRWTEAKAAGATSLPTVGCRRKQILTVTRREYEDWADKAEAGWLKAAQFLHEQKIFSHRDLPYRSQLIPLAAILAVLDKDADSAPARSLIRQWFWCSVLGELYGSQPHSRFASDIQELTAMIQSGEGRSTTINEAEFSTNRLSKLRTRNSAAYKGINILVMQHGAMDFFSKQKIEDVHFFADKIDIHHVFPQKWCDDHNVDPGLKDCILNRTPLREKTNKQIAARSPSDYIADPAMKPHAREALESHAIGIEQMKKDDFDRFLLDRAERLLKLIDKAMGKSPNRDPLEFLTP